MNRPATANDGALDTLPKRLAEQARGDLGDRLTKREGSGIREAGRLGPDDKRLIP